jgi:hypothetical protein
VVVADPHLQPAMPLPWGRGIVLLAAVPACPSKCRRVTVGAVGAELRGGTLLPKVQQVPCGPVHSAPVCPGPRCRDAPSCSTAEGYKPPGNRNKLKHASGLLTVLQPAQLGTYLVMLAQFASRGMTRSVVCLLDCLEYLVAGMQECPTAVVPELLTIITEVFVSPCECMPGSATTSAVDPRASLVHPWKPSSCFCS